MGLGWSGGGGVQIPSFLFNPLCDDGNAVSRFNKISRYYFQTAECKLTACLTAETNGGVIRRPVLLDLRCLDTKRSCKPLC